MFGLWFGMCHSHHTVEARLHEERKARKKLQKDTKEVKQALLPKHDSFSSGLQRKREQSTYTI
jgi:hypothetical protein